MDLLSLYIKVHQADIPHAALCQSLVVEQHLIDFSVIYSVLIVVKFFDHRLRVVIMPGKYHAHIRVHRHDFVVHSLRLFPETAACQQVFMEIQDCFSLRVLRKHIVHPPDLFIADAPSHVDHDKINAAHRDQVVMPFIVLVASFIPRIRRIPPLSEIFAEVIVIFCLMSHIMVAGKDPVRESCLVEHPVRRVRVLPLGGHRLIIDQVSVVEEILDIHPASVGDQPVMDRKLGLVLSDRLRIVRRILVIILRITFDRKCEIISAAVLITLIGCRRRLINRSQRRRSRRILGRSISLARLYHDLYLLSGQMILQRDQGCKLCCAFFFGPLCRGLLPHSCDSVIDVHLCLRAVRLSFPFHLDRSILADIFPNCDVELLIRESVGVRAVKHILV